MRKLVRGSQSLAYKAHMRKGGRAPVGHGLGNLLDRVLATVVGPAKATITSAIVQWWNQHDPHGKLPP